MILDMLLNDLLHYHFRFNGRNKYSGQSYKASTIVIYNSRVVPNLKIPYIMTLES